MLVHRPDDSSAELGPQIADWANRAPFPVGADGSGNSALGTLRGDPAAIITQSIVHGSDSTDSAERELKLFFD